MFDHLTKKLQTLFSSLGKNKKLSEENLSDAVREVRLALLEADVNYSVASTFVKRVKDKVLGDTVIKSVTPTQQFMKIVHDELVSLMGDKEAELDLKGSPSVIMLCGLQGSGKTTQSAKLAYYLKSKGKKVLLAGCDLQRPAAVEQLRKLASEIDVPVFWVENEKQPLVVAKRALDKAKNEKFDVLIVDTAGRLHLDEELMNELEDLKKLLLAKEVLFVANATTGQDAVKTAAEFDKRVNITGSILTMLDGDARAGAAISIREITNKPLKFEGIGEKISDFQMFNPHSMADRILGMGDVINLVRKAEMNISEEESLKMEEKLKKASFTYDDYLRQMGMVKKMGSIKSLMKMIPGFSSFGDLDFSEKEMKKVESIIYSMTKEERVEKVEINFPRRKRIALGSGTKLDDVNRLIKGFKRIKQLFKGMKTKGMLSTMKQQMGGNKTWR